MYSDWGWLLSSVIFIWLLALSFFIWQEHVFLKSLFPKDGERDIRKKFEELLEGVEDSNKEITKLKKWLEELDEEGLSFVQKVELLRFNPYDETGGDQSFAVALLNKKGTGFVLTSLHARSGTRVFAKPILEGKSSKYKLSKEEEQVVKKAINE